MNQHLTALYIYIFIHLIINVLSQTISYDLKKYGEYVSKKGYAIFDPTGFSFGDFMYFKITAKSFEVDILHYEYLDDFTDYQFECTEPCRSVKSYYENEEGGGGGDDDDDDDDDKKIIKYFKIEKKQDDLKGSEGKYLVLYFYTSGITTIENTEKDEGKASDIIGTVIAIIAAIVIIVILALCCYRYCKRKKTKQNANVNVNNNPYVYNIPNNQNKDNVQNAYNQNNIQNINNYQNMNFKSQNNNLNLNNNNNTNFQNQNSEERNINYDKENGGGVNNNVIQGNNEITMQNANGNGDLNEKENDNKNNGDLNEIEKKSDNAKKDNPTPNIIINYGGNVIVKNGEGDKDSEDKKSDDDSDKPKKGIISLTFDCINCIINICKKKKNKD